MSELEEIASNPVVEAPYGYKKDGSPKQRPGRKVGWRKYQEWVNEAPWDEDGLHGGHDDNTTTS